MSHIDPPTPDPLTAEADDVIADALVAAFDATNPRDLEAIHRNLLAALPSAPDHSCANHDETLDEAYRKGWADGASAPDQRLREALEHAKYSNHQTHGAHLDHPGTCGGEFVVGNCMVRAALSEATTSPEATLDVVRQQYPVELEIRQHHRVVHRPGISGDESWCDADDVRQPCDTQVFIGLFDALTARLRGPA